MGWSYACDPTFGRKEQIADLRKPHAFTEGYTLVESRVVGNHFWGLIEKDGHKAIMLVMMAGGGRSRGWGYKSMQENSLPTALDCPLSLLDKASPPANENVRRWREMVRAQHALDKARPKPKPGMVVRVHDTLYTLVEPHHDGPRMGWIALRVSDGMRFRIPAGPLSRAEVQPTQEIQHDQA